MTVKQCDRCGDTYNPYVGINVITKKPRVFQIDLGQSEKDLCPNCTEKFFQFLHPEKEKETEDIDDDAIEKVIDELHDIKLRLDDGPFNDILESAQVLLRTVNVENKILRKELEIYESDRKDNK